MNSLEFKELQNEMGDLLYKYESFLKKAHILDCKLVNEYNDLMLDSLHLRAENGLLATVCKLLNENKSLDEVDSTINELKKQYATNKANFENKIVYVKKFVDTLKDEETTKELEQRFKEFIKENHPAVKILITKAERMTYDELRKLYLDNNLLAYEAFLDLQKSFIRPCQLTEKDYNNANAYYYQIRTNLVAEMEKKKNEYPYSLESVFENDMSIARHRANHIIENNKLRALNKSLHKDVIEVYGEDVNI